MSRLRMQNFSIIGHGVPEIQGVTHRQTQDEDLLYRRRRRYKRRCTLTCTAHFVGPPELMNWFSWMRRWRKKPGWFPKLDISYYLLGDFSDSLFMFWLQLWHNIHLYPLNLKNPFCGPLPNKTSPSKTVYPKKQKKNRKRFLILSRFDMSYSTFVFLSIPICQYVVSWMTQRIYI